MQYSERGPVRTLLDYLMDVRPLPTRARNDREYCGHEETRPYPAEKCGQSIAVKRDATQRDRWPRYAFHASARCSASVQNLGNFVEMGIDLIGQIVKLTPSLAKVRRLVGGL
jgi:hypothetical protein